MYCRKCGKQIPDISDFCLYCGNKVEFIEEDDTDSNENNQEIYQSSNTMLNHAEYKQDNHGSQTTYYGDKSNKHSKEYKSVYIVMGGLVLIFVIIVVFLSGFGGPEKYDKNTNPAKVTTTNKNTLAKRDNSELKHHTYTGVSSTLTMDGPFTLRDFTLKELDKSVSHYLYKAHQEKGLSQEVIALKYNVALNDDSLKNILDKSFSKLSGDSARYNNYKSYDTKFVRINGQKAAQKEVSVYDSIAKTTYTINWIAVRKDNELWFVVVGYDKNDKEANEQANRMIDSIRLN